MGPALGPETSLILLTQRCTETATATARDLPRDELLARPLKDLVAQVVADTVPQRIELDLDAREVSAGETTIHERQGIFWGQHARFDATVIRVHIPYTGDVRLFTYSPSQMPLHRPEVDHTDHEVVITITGSNPDLPEVQDAINQRQTHLIKWVEAVNHDVRRIEDRVRGELTRILTSRQTRLQQANQLLDALDIPVKHVDALELPTEPAALALTSETGPTGRPEWRLAADAYEKILDTIIRFAHALERRPASALGLIPNEETLRDWIVFFLNSNHQNDPNADLFVVGEAVNGAGKTDILVRQHDVNAFIGECKFWRGQAAFTSAIDQLLGYTVWRDTKAAVILFIKDQNPTDVIAKADVAVLAHRQFVAAADQQKPDQRLDYVLSSPQDPQRRISLALIPVVVPSI